MVAGRVIVAGAARGELLRLSAPVLAVESAVGSSSSSAIMLELIREHTAPAALLLGSADAIVALGVVVAGELGLPTVPVLEVSWKEILSLPEGPVEVEDDGTIRTAESS